MKTEKDLNLNAPSSGDEALRPAGQPSRQERAGQREELSLSGIMAATGCNEAEAYIALSVASIRNPKARAALAKARGEKDAG